MSQTRLKWLLAGLTLLLMLRWLDPWPPVRTERGADVVQAIVRAAPHEDERALLQETRRPSGDREPVGLQHDRLASSSPVHDLFITRSAVSAQAQQAEQSAAQKAVQKALRKQPPPPSPPPEPVVPPENPPQLQVVGTWAGDDRPAVFMSTPHGTVMARESELLLGQYKVQRIDPRLISLQNTQTQKVWQLPIPDAPTATTAWPSRQSQ